MKNLILFLTLFISTIIIGQSYEPTQLFIKVNAEISIRYDEDIAIVGISEIDDLNYEYNCVNIEKMFEGEDEILDQWFIFTFNTETDMSDLKGIYEEITEYIPYVDLAYTLQTGSEPNDPFFTLQYNKAFYDSKLPEAWDIEQGNSSLKIGIIDNGLYWNHPDISLNNIYQNTTGGSNGHGEDANQNGYTIYISNGIKYFDTGDLNSTDDDGNGYIDDLSGYNFESNNYNFTTTSYADNHGANMFGLIAATANNQEGSAGASYNSKVIHCRAGSGGYMGFNWVKAIKFLADKGVCAINMSFFGAGYQQSTQDAITYAYNHNTMIFACGGFSLNSSCPENMYYPALYNYVVAVGVLESDGTYMRLGSNVGPKMDLLGSRMGAYPNPGLTPPYSNSMHSSGTTALNVGIASLLRAHFSTWTIDQIYNQMFITAINKEDDNRTNSCNFDFLGKIGHGLADAEYALSFDGLVDRDLIWNKTLNVYWNINVQNGKTLTLRSNSNLVFQPNKTFTVHGTLVIEGNLTINRDIIISTDGELQIQPGANITFENGAKLTVYGIMSALGTSNNGITYTFNSFSFPPTDSYIRFSGASCNAELTYNTINWGIGLQCMNGSNVEIDHCTLNNCYEGIYIYSAEPILTHNSIDDPYHNGIYGEASGYEPKIGSNLITKTNHNYQNYQGIYLGNYTNPYIYNNQIHGFSNGMYLGGGLVSWFTIDDGLETPDINNQITENNTGLCVAWGATVLAGYYEGTGGKNSIHNNNTLDLSVYNSGTLWADYNYFGGGEPVYSCDGSSFIDFANYLTEDPWGDGLHNSISAASIRGGEIDSIMLAFLLEKRGNVDEAVLIYKDFITKSKNINIALSNLTRIFRKYERNEIEGYLIGLGNSKPTIRAKIHNLLGNIYLMQNKFTQSMNEYNFVIENYSEHYEGISARFNKLFAYVNVKNDLNYANQIFVEIQNLNITDPEMLIKLSIAQSLLNFDTGDRSSFKQKILTSIPDQYELASNYPNPFNPSTRINYQIPLAGFVIIKVYDLLGKEVAELVNENKEPGYYSIDFDGSKLSSGMYIYVLKSNNFYSSKKMLLLK